MKDLEPNSLTPNQSKPPTPWLAIGASVFVLVCVCPVWVGMSANARRSSEMPDAQMPTPKGAVSPAKSARVVGKKPRIDPKTGVFVAVLDDIKSKGGSIEKIHAEYEHEGQWAQQIEYTIGVEYLTVAHYLSNGKLSRSEVRARSKVNTPPYTISNERWMQESGVVYCAGTIVNQTSETWRYVQVQINILGNDREVLSSTLDNANNIEPGQKWKFRALALNAPKGATFKITGVSFH